MTTTLHITPDELLNQQDLPLDTVLDRHFSPGYRQRANGHWDDRAAFARHARKLVAAARIEALDELRDGDRYAERHRIRLTRRDGTHSAHEVYLFAQLDAAGRFLRVEETTLMLDGSDEDRDIGQVK